MADQPTRPSARGDEADLFRAHTHQLLRDVDRALRNSTPAVIEDACSFAWAQFMHYQPDRDRNWQGWLFRTAQREAWRLEREVRDHKPLRTTEDERKVDFAEPIAPRDDYAISTDVGDALSIVRQLPPRLQRIAMLRALGLRYREISEVTGDTPTRVGQLVARANLEIHEILGERAHHERELTPRAERLWQLEHEQPAWLVEKLGRLPGASRRRVSQGARRRAWRRAALALDDLRNLAGAERFDEALATRPAELELRRPHEVARRAIEELDHERDRGRRIGD